MSHPLQVARVAAGALVCLLASAARAEPWQPLGDHGVRFDLGYTGEAAANPVGGLRQDAAYAGQVYVGVDLDLARLARIPGATVHVAATNRHGDNLAATAIGNNTSVQEIFGTQNTHLAILTWQQKLGDHVGLEAGRTIANVSFLSSPYYCNFQSNSACGNPTFVFKTSNFTYFPASSWGGHARAWLGSRVYLHAGVYEVNPDRKQADDHGVSFGIAHATGVVVPFEIGYATTRANDRLPRAYQLGGWYDTGDYEDPIVDPVTGPVTRHGRSGVFARFEQLVWRPDATSARGLGVFGVAMARTSGRTTEDFFVEAGALWTGPLASRAEDTLGFVVNDQVLSDLALDTIRGPRVAAGGTAAIPRHEIMMELAYGAQLFRGIRVSPNLQLIVHPDQLAEPARPTDIPTAFVVGLKASIELPALLGS
ncbi:MAG: carbohydrate porin [Deltaproteobacteria bacterium]|nr:carbohydrate porin [Deltaproteobacteria bacterium]